MTRVVGFGLALCTILVVSASSAPVPAQPPLNEPALRALLLQPSLPESYRRSIENYLTKPVQQIIGGRKALPGELPWQVSLGVAQVPDARWAHFCGGVIYRSNWVITAAHCVAGLDKTGIAIVAGDLELTEASLRRPVDDIELAPGYVKGGTANDVALLRLATPIVTSPTTRPVDIVPPAVEATFVNRQTTLVVGGWGQDALGGLAVLDLQLVPLPYVSSAECSKPLSYPPDPTTGRPQITNQMICAGSQSGTIGACLGDSGGPLIYGVGPAARVVGVDSWEAGCTVVYKYNVFSRLNQYRTWLEHVAGPPSI